MRVIAHASREKSRFHRPATIRSKQDPASLGLLPDFPERVSDRSRVGKRLNSRRPWDVRGDPRTAVRVVVIDGFRRLTPGTALAVNHAGSVDFDPPDRKTFTVKADGFHVNYKKAVRFLTHKCSFDSSATIA